MASLINQILDTAMTQRVALNGEADYKSYTRRSWKQSTIAQFQKDAEEASDSSRSYKG